MEFPQPVASVHRSCPLSFTRSHSAPDWIALVPLFHSTMRHSPAAAHTHTLSHKYLHLPSCPRCDFEHASDAARSHDGHCERSKHSDNELEGNAHAGSRIVFENDIESEQSMRVEESAWMVYASSLQIATEITFRG